MITKLYIRAQQTLIDFKKDQRGVTAIEYAVLGVAVAAAVPIANVPSNPVQAIYGLLFLVVR